jgi:hypothetical protein
LGIAHSVDPASTISLWNGYHNLHDHCLGLTINGIWVLISEFQRKETIIFKECRPCYFGPSVCFLERSCLLFTTLGISYFKNIRGPGVVTGYQNSGPSLNAKATEIKAQELIRELLNHCSSIASILGY